MRVPLNQTCYVINQIHKRKHVVKRPGGSRKENNKE